MSPACVGVQISLEITNPGRNAADGRHVLERPQPWRGGCWGAAAASDVDGLRVSHTDPGEMVTEQHVMVSQGTQHCSSHLPCEREDLTDGHPMPWLSSGGEPLGVVDGDDAGTQGCGLPLSPCSPAWPVRAQQG